MKVVMSKVIKKSNIKDSKKIALFKEYWSKENYVILFLGIVVLVIGYFLMSINPWDNFISLNISPIVLLIAYIVILPLSFLLKFKK